MQFISAGIDAANEHSIKEIGDARKNKEIIKEKEKEIEEQNSRMMLLLIFLTSVSLANSSLSTEKMLGHLGLNITIGLTTLGKQI